MEDKNNPGGIPKQNLFLPPYLQDLGYGNLECVRKLSTRAIIEKETHIDDNPIWSEWRGIFEYMSFVEYSRELLQSIPKGRELGSIHVVPARYHSAALVFFAQATLDNIASWIKCQFPLEIRGADLAFHKAKFNEAVRTIDHDLSLIISKHSIFITRLNEFRVEWIHRLTGGANVYSDKIPSDLTANI